MSIDSTLALIEPDWGAPAHVKALCTTRQGGVSEGRYASLNLAGHVGDDRAHVAANRELLCRALALPSEPVWLTQVHGREVRLVDSTDSPRHQAAARTADAAVATRPGRICVVMTADCLPILLCDARGTAVAAVHAGWRGLLDGVIEAAVTRLRAAVDQPPAGRIDRIDRIRAWLGPAIGPDAFEVGAEVYDLFRARDADAATAFRPGTGGLFMADLYALARQRLAAVGVREISGGGHCTLGEPERFFSYRRDGCTGRMASLIWIDPAAGART